VAGFRPAIPILTLSRWIRASPKYKIGQHADSKLWTGALWAEGCAWNGVGRYVHVERYPQQSPDAIVEREMVTEPFVLVANNARLPCFA